MHLSVAQKDTARLSDVLQKVADLILRPRPDARRRSENRQQKHGSRSSRPEGGGVPLHGALKVTRRGL